MILSKQISKLMSITAMIKNAIDDMRGVVISNRVDIIKNLNMAAYYLDRAIEGLRKE